MECWSYFCKRFRNMKVLYVFDFDRTLISCNSEDVYNDLLTPVGVRKLLSEDTCSNWATTCPRILNLLKAQGTSLEDILFVVRSIHLIPGMDTLLQNIYMSLLLHNESQLIILSGSNDLFISTILKSLSPPVFPNAILANHLNWSVQQGYLVFEPFYPLPKTCPFCPPSLCKGDAMDEYITDNGPFDRIYYTGDGGNDVCPAIRLRKQDVLFVKIGLNLEAAIKTGTYNNLPVKVLAKVFYFNDASEISERMEIPKT